MIWRREEQADASRIRLKLVYHLGNNCFFVGFPSFEIFLSEDFHHLRYFYCKDIRGGDVDTWELSKVGSFQSGPAGRCYCFY